jgi:pimeloyl-ACP methyl ester carboxylesterase
MATITVRSALAAVNGIELAYQIHGSGKPLVLLHGGFGSVEMFGPNVAALAAGRQVIGVDLQSHGRTPVVDRRSDPLSSPRQSPLDVAGSGRHPHLARTPPRLSADGP